MKNGYMNKFLSRGLFLLAFWAMLPGCYASNQTSQNKAFLDKEMMRSGCFLSLGSGSATKKRSKQKSTVQSTTKKRSKQNSTVPSTQNSGNVYVLQSQMSPVVLEEQKVVFSKQECKKQQNLPPKEQYVKIEQKVQEDVDILNQDIAKLEARKQGYEGKGKKVPKQMQEKLDRKKQEIGQKTQIINVIQKERKEKFGPQKVLQNTAHHSIGVDINVECGIKRGKGKVGYGAIARLGFDFAVFNKNQPSKKKSSENDLQISDTKNRFSVTGTVTPFISLYDKVAFGPVLGLKWSTLHLAKGFERSNILSIPVGLEVIVAASDNLSVILAYRYEICVWKSKILNGVKCGNHYVGLSCSCKLYSAKSGFYVAANAGLNYNCRQFKFDGKGADAYKDLIAKFENVSRSDKKQDANCKECEARSPDCVLLSTCTKNQIKSNIS